MPLEIMKELDGGNEPQRRRSARLSPSQTNQTSDNKMAPSAAFVKRRITVKKIAPRKNTLASTIPSPILPSPPPPLTAKIPKVQTRARTPEIQTKNQTPKVQTRKQTPKVQTQTEDQNHQPDPVDMVWSQKVRRSYSRLSDTSLNSPNSRLTLFGFEKLQTPEVIRKDGNKSGLEASGSFSTLPSFMSLLEAEDYLNIPGVVVVKQKRRRKKVQCIDNNEIEELAAKMNAEFEEAEEFELFVE
uniref:Cell division cycle associated 5 n=1 Tax=Periophthalmus magnuspinnatus TaxID=409849 RepID=A0A3B4BKF3_9GOBI